MLASNQYPIRRNAALRYASFAIADGQQLRLGTIPCASDGTVLSIPRAATPQRHREAGQARGGLPIAEFIETPLSARRDRCSVTLTR